MDTCAIDAACDPQVDFMQRSVVQLTQFQQNNFCTGTLMKGPGDKIYILSARHCLSMRGLRFVYPWSSYSVIFDYALPCNASRVSDIPSTFGRYLTGLAIVFEDELSDIAVFELLQDIPPEWGPILAGWDATELDGNFTFTAVSNPQGDTQKVTTGIVSVPFYRVVVNDDHSVSLVTNVSCETHTCGFYLSALTSGALTVGSSGCGLYHDGLGKIVGTLSSGLGSCALPSDPWGEDAPRKFFGALAAAWEHGFHRLFDLPRDGERSAEYEEYTRALPTITVGNIVPEVNPRLGATHMTIALQQRPERNTTITISPAEPWLVTVSPRSISFTTDNWSATQQIAITARPDRPETSATLQFQLNLTWPVVDEAGRWSERIKSISGVVWAERKGTSFFNPQEVQAPFRHVADLERFNPQVPLIAQHIGPFVPAQYFSYKAGESEGIVIETCPHTRDPNAHNMTATIFGSLWTTNKAIPQRTKAVSIPRTGCTQVLAGLPGGQSELGVPVLDQLEKEGDVSMITSLPAREIVEASTTPTTYFFRPEADLTLNITTCSEETTVGSGLEVLDDHLRIIR
ncbi:hypothetical protein F751_0458 [Auxenochlorella protothecoides]|uniref:Peptidase S1 domain-containing protein n=1 Tax=Auxenochlorella protothecoides TaxID=3075 RepID=A0A087SAA8_AUXPR|nr:hypothetical protein F751_0458 [Auxenochlorella protothecoides]KFM22662.1 hypothetical protein F751_0458 [Auxenochlorella protothecoides]